MSSTIVPDLLTTPDLLAWANQNGYPSVMSYTEAHLANRLVIKLKGGGAGKARILARLYLSTTVLHDSLQSWSISIRDTLINLIADVT